MYALLPSTALSYLIAVKSLAIGTDHFPFVSNVYAAIAAGHAFFIACMLIGSVASRQLAFFWWPKSPWRQQSRLQSITSIAPTTASVIGAAAPTISRSPSKPQTERTPARSRVARTPTLVASLMAQPQIVRARAIVSALFGRKGLFGVNGRHFERIMLTRELVEASLQTMQAYQLARLLPRLMLVRAYVAMLVVNCASTLLLHRLIPSNLPLQRMVCLVCDLALDFASVIGVWTAVAYRYAEQYDPLLQSFPIDLLTNDVWYINFVNDFQLVLISSWLDLGSQFVFFVSIFSAINDVKLLLHRRASPSVGPETTAVPAVHQRMNGVDPHHTILTDADATASRELDARLQSAAKLERYSSAYSRVLQALIALLGGVILAVHAYAETRPSIPGCRLEVLTWFRSQSGCALLEIDCYHIKATGSQLEIATEVHKVSPESLEHLSFVHCPSLHVPPAIQQLRQLRVLKIYNSTIEQWDMDAALTKTHHPRLGVLVAARVNMTDRRLPAGLMSPQFPPSLVSMQLCVVNLATLPDEIASIWPQRLSLMWESSGITAIPRALAKMSIVCLSLADNAISELPPALFYIPGLVLINLGGNPFSDLTPATAPSIYKDAVPLATISFAQITFTQVAALPERLISALLAASSSSVVLARSTPLCASIESNQAGLDGRLVELYARGKIDCMYGGNSRSFPLETVTAQYAIRD